MGLESHAKKIRITLRQNDICTKRFLTVKSEQPLSCTGTSAPYEAPTNAQLLDIRPEDEKRDVHRNDGQFLTCESAHTQKPKLYMFNRRQRNMLHVVCGNGLMLSTDILFRICPLSR
jgi:hypothetical protein